MPVTKARVIIFQHETIKTSPQLNMLNYLIIVDVHCMYHYLNYFHSARPCPC